MFIRYVFPMINIGQRHAGMISKETQLNIILRNALPLSISSHIGLSSLTIGILTVNLSAGTRSSCVQ